VSTRTKGEGVEPVRKFFGQGDVGVKFSQFCADVLYGRTLTATVIDKLMFRTAKGSTTTK